MSSAQAVHDAAIFQSCWFHLYKHFPFLFAFHAQNKGLCRKWLYETHCAYIIRQQLCVLREAATILMLAYVSVVTLPSMLVRI